VLPLADVLDEPVIKQSLAPAVLDGADGIADPDDDAVEPAELGFELGGAAALEQGLTFRREAGSG
jgi:hypothetical protein